MNEIYFIISWFFLVTDDDREIAEMLVDEEFGRVKTRNFSGTGLELESKIDKVYNFFKY